MCGCMVNIQSVTAENRGEKEERKKKKKIETTAAKYNDLPYWAAIKSKQHRNKMVKTHKKANINLKKT